ncbi:hypothetical protein [Lacipirellula limnantheis]|uniref:Uncharacterized protein n=1 Tax=Lacipirellula limnantheis TaxID=2528024 RepID=A0A517TUV4_9BACT|nr:hypothetical protein [Lacipirellula limnantheis]QDT72154.1 hypothetical protein I41_13210 [Lacipirellula limnantheis]
MDKVRAFLKAAWLQRFWILSVVGTLAAVVCWMMASGELQRQFTANKTQIDGKFSEMKSIKDKSVHGNPGVNAKEREEAKKIADSVKKLWQSLFDAQREEVLKWPAVLGADFVTYVENAKFDSQIKPLFRDRYQNYIKNRFDGLVEIVDAKKMPVEGAATFGPGMGRMGEGGGAAETLYDAQGNPIEEDYLVQWLDQANLRQQLEFTGVPTSRQIWVTQEDLWVYETLLRAIANTNKERGATRPDNTAIRVIQSLEVGAPAGLAMAQESVILMPAEAMGAGGEAPPMERPMGEGGAEGVDVDAMLLAGRYIDAEGKPIADAASGMGTEFRRLPIRMVLMMDERWLPKILVECANAPLPIEVQRLRINREKSGIDKDGQAFEMAAAAGGPGMGGPGMGMGRGGEMGMGRPMGMGMGRGGEGRSMGMGPGMGGMGAGMSLNPADTANLATVEIQGVVYIYMPPDATILTVPGDDAAASPDALAAGDAAVVR